MWGEMAVKRPASFSRSGLEGPTREGDGPVGEGLEGVVISRVPRFSFAVGRWEEATSKAKYVSRPIAKQYCEGTLKSTPEGG
jgi:hypothetical protein